ncbi:MAG: IclR family transcriptional regulator C-terminal domain-containing protein [Desulfatiglandales bacterium]
MVKDQNTPLKEVHLKRVEERFETIQVKGYAISFGGRTRQAAAIAVPIFDHEGKSYAALSPTGSIQSFLPDRYPDLLQRVLRMARILSDRLEYGLSER